MHPTPLFRCFGNKPHQNLLAHYHDHEWGIPVYNDHQHFELLILEGAQAGLTWETVLKKRTGYRNAFHQFDPQKVAALEDTELEILLENPALIRHRLKIFSARKNACVFLNIQKEFGSFNDYVWGFVDGKPLRNQWTTLQEIPARTKQSDALSKDLKKRGMSFVGSTIIYAYMQAAGLVNDHVTSCWLYKKTQEEG